MHTPRVLITAGPTHEPIDAVRYIANRSSGRMGLALAHAAAERGWPTTILLGPIDTSQADLRVNSQVQVFRFRSTADLQHLLHTHWRAHDVLFMAAAVADYTPKPDAHTLATKLKRVAEGDQPLHLELEPTPDLLEQLASITKPHQFAVGFALEPGRRGDLIDSALSKLQQKRLDAIVANPLQTMDSPNVSAELLLADGSHVTAPANLPKPEFANWLLDALESRILAKCTTRV